MRRLDRTSLVAGLVLVVGGIFLLLDRTGELDLDVGVLWPALAFGAGVVLVTAGLDRDRRP